MAVESVRSSGAHLASGGWAGQAWTLGSHCCIPSLGGVVLPLRYVFSLSFFFFFSFGYLNLLGVQVAKAKLDCGVAALGQQLPLSSLPEPLRHAARQSWGRLKALPCLQISRWARACLLILSQGSGSWMLTLMAACCRLWHFSREGLKSHFMCLPLGSRNLVARIRSTLYVIMASLSKCLLMTNMQIKFSLYLSISFLFVFYRWIYPWLTLEFFWLLIFFFLK